MAPKAREKPKPSPPAQSQPSVALEDLFSTLHRHTQNFEYNQIVKVTDQILAIAPGDEDALRCKIVALIKSDSIDRALSVIEASKNIPIDLRFYKAYCLYRQNKLHEALDTLKDQERSASSLQLESQILYRMGRMDACMESYEKLQMSKADSFSLELKTNFVAAMISAGRASEVQKMMDTFKVKATSSFELAYNAACSLIEKRKYPDAEQLLLSARRIGQEMLMEEDYADDEIEAELAPILVQLAYIRQLLGNTQEAIEAYTDILNRNLADASSLAVATNNLIALKGTKDTSDGLRKFDKLIEKGGTQLFQLAHGLDFKLSPRQKECIYSNRILLLLHANRMDQARELVSALQDMFPDSVTPVLLQAAVLTRENKAGKAEEILGQFSDKFPENAKPILLARAQVAAAAGHPHVAADSLSRVADIQHMPATVATLVSLKERAGDIGGAFSVLDDAILWWTNAMSEDSKLGLIMHEAAAFKLKHGRDEEAAHLYEELVKSHGSVDALVGLVTTAAHVDVDKAEAYAKQLRKLPRLKEIDVESLERSSGAKHAESGRPMQVEVAPDEVKEKVKAKKKRKRKPRYPKGFDPANPGPPPDPERWLPKRERSSYRPKRKDKRAAQVRGSQGAVVREKHDPNAGSSTTKSSQAAAGPSSKGSSSDQPKPSRSRKKSRS